jgi:lipopolysaccharide transport system ATP-binding protein
LAFKTGDRMIIRYTIIAYQDFEDDLTLGFTIRNKFVEVYGTNTRWRNCDLSGIKTGYMPVVTISMNLSLGTGTYSLTSAIAILHSGLIDEVLDRREDHIIFYVKNDEGMSGFADLESIIRIE